ncbi:hypothetical protein IHE45_05G033500 [Dioscorea alata]|uniref:Uncharacterized protein n=1 Tax=Dioscorea alata TaxID=55571 RepID=A0ACB7W0T2_DIOAL|nr:hypothetical protein IHE45_05G033500 [Dioscorea alata]
MEVKLATASCFLLIFMLLLMHLFDEGGSTFVYPCIHRQGRNLKTILVLDFV